MGGCQEMASLKDFTSKMKDGLARTSHFKVTFTIPPALLGAKATYSANLSMFSVFCDTFTIPGLTYSTNPVRTYGEQREVPYERLYGNANMSLYIDGAFYVKSFFDDWMDSIQDKETRDFKYASGYMLETIPVEVYDMAESPRYRVILHRCFPKSIGQIQLDYAGKDVMKLNVEMSYQFYRTENIGINKAGGLLPATTQSEIDNLNRPQIPSPLYTANNTFQYDTQLPDQQNEFVGRGAITQVTTP